MCGSCVRKCCVPVCHRFWFHAHRTHLSLLFCFVLYSRNTWSNSWFIGLFEPSLSLVFFDPNAFFLAVVSGHVLGEFHSSNISIPIHNPFMLLCTHFEFTLSSPMHIQQMYSWASFFFFYVLDCNEEHCYCFNNACTFHTCNSSLGLESRVLLTKLTLRSCSFIDQQMTFLSFALHQDFITSPLSIFSAILSASLFNVPVTLS